MLALELVEPCVNAAQAAFLAFEHWNCNLLVVFWGGEDEEKGKNGEERKVRATREVVRVRRVENCILMMVCWSGEMVVC